MYYRALGAYYEHEAWKGTPAAMPRGGGRLEQPFEWLRAIECVRAALNRHRREEDIKEWRLREAGKDQ